MTEITRWISTVYQVHLILVWAFVLITVPSGLVLQHWMLGDINRRGPFERISHLRRLYWTDMTELEKTHRELFPNSWKHEIFHVLRKASIVGAILIAAFLVTGLILSRTAQTR